jgi:hypothetical protein
MSTIDVIEKSTIFTGTPFGGTTNPANYTVGQPEPEMVWIVVLLGSVMGLIYTFLKGKS